MTAHALHFRHRRMGIGFVLRCAGLAGALVIAGALALAGCIVAQGARDEAAPADVIVVLGAAQWNGQPSPVLRARLDHAALLFERGYTASVIVGGGTAPGDTLSEAEVGRRYLIDRGLPPSAVVAMPVGSSTWETLQAVAEPLHSQQAHTVILVSDDFHMWRTISMARDLGLRAYGSPTRTSPIRRRLSTEASFVAREVLAYVHYRCSRVLSSA